MRTLSNSPGGWKSRTLWVVLILAFITLIFLLVWLWTIQFTAYIALEFARQGVEPPAVLTIAIQTFPLGAMVASLGAAATALIGGNKIRDAASNFLQRSQDEKNETDAG